MKVLVQCMRPVAVDAKTIECWYLVGREVAIAATTRGAVRKIEADFPRQYLSAIEQQGDTGVLFEWRAVELAGHRDPDVGIIGSQASQVALHSFRVGYGPDPHVDCCLAELWHSVVGSAAFDLSDVEGDTAYRQQLLFGAICNGSVILGEDRLPHIGGRRLHKVLRYFEISNQGVHAT